MDNHDDPAQQHRLCRQYGFNTAHRQHRLSLLNLGAQDAIHLEIIQQLVLQPCHTTIMDAFYEFVLKHPELRQFLKNDDHIVRLKQTQTEYLLSLGKNFESCDYFEYRLRVGIAHARINMPLSSYLVAYGRLQEILIVHMNEHGLSGMYNTSLCKILMLDMSLAIDAYNVSQMHALSESVDQLKSEKTRLNIQLMHDTLTDAYSRAYILEQLDKRLSELQRNDSKQLAIALIDIDHFKSVNDTYGHSVGDRVLYEFTQTCQKMIRRQDYFGRYGGEEFLLVFVELNEDQVFELAERIRNELANKIYHFDQHRFHITASFGLAIATPGETTTVLIEKADQALYEAKNSGRNKIILRGPSI